jgi:hypothetical protein
MAVPTGEGAKGNSTRNRGAARAPAWVDGGPSFVRAEMGSSGWKAAIQAQAMRKLRLMLSSIRRLLLASPLLRLHISRSAKEESYNDT